MNTGIHVSFQLHDSAFDRGIPILEVAFSFIFLIIFFAMQKLF